MSEAPIRGAPAPDADDAPATDADGAPAPDADGAPARLSRGLRSPEPTDQPFGGEVAKGPGGPGRHRAAPATVRVAGGRLQDDLRAVAMVWRRELIRFGRNRLRIITSLVQPVLFLFVLGTGLSSLMGRGLGAGVDFRTFMFPGVVAMTVLFTAIFSSVSIVWDREFGFLREMLVAPVRRGALVIGKCAGGATVATFQAFIMLALAGFVQVPYAPSLIFTLLGEMVLAAVMITALGTALASRMAQVESFQVVMQFVVLPLFFLSGALFPLRDLPSWLAVLTKFDPLAYVVDAMRRAVFGHVRTTPVLRTLFAGGVTWNGWTVPIGLELGITAALGAVLLGIAVYTFGKTD